MRERRIRVMAVIARMSGGAARDVIGLHRLQNPEEFDHRVYTGFVEAEEEDLLQLHDVAMPVHRVPGLGRSIRPADDYRALIHLVKAMRAFRPHIVHTRTAKAGALGRVAARLSGIGSAQAHAFHGHLLHGYFSPPKRYVYVQAERFLASISDRLVTVGRQVRDDLLEAGIGHPQRYVVIPPIVQLGHIPDRGAARSTLNLPVDAPVVAFIGRLTQVKRLDRLVETAREVLRRVPDCQFVICGDGELRSEVEHRIAPLRRSFHLLGWRKDVETVYSAADLVLLTSDNEGTPLAAIEAGMAGTPAVSTRVGSVEEVIKHGFTGLLATPNAHDLAVQAVRLLSDQALARRMGESARQWTLSTFGPERVVADTAALYRSLAGSLAGDRRVSLSHT